MIWKNPEKNKKIAFRDYVEKVIEGADKMVNSKYYKLSVGFSDDDLGDFLSDFGIGLN